MSQADSEDRLAAHQAADVVYRVGAGFGIAGAVGEKNSVGLQRQHVFRWSLRRDNRHLATFAAQLAQDVVLDAEVVGDYVEAWRLVFDSDDFYRLVRALAYFPDIGTLGADDLG